MLALVLDTSSAAVTAGLVDFDRPEPAVLAERVTVDARAHAELLAPALRDCLAAAGVRLDQLSAVVAGVGPGPFTGLRVGLMTAAALADATGLPSYGVCSLDAIAARVAGTAELLVAGDARRKEVYWARYRHGARLADPAVGKPAELVAELRGELFGRTAAMAGAGARLYAEVLGLPLLDADYPTPAGLAACAADRVRGRAPGEVLVPLYLRRPDAVEPGARKPVTA
ncbi:tRNA (adenosine(37)-N6)-threonylcarbamoyltransferase complex dimerization subunit type 1 TsaB [Jatrophihabitans sp.]|uniref:tRNA (adenosine(37)-N6)-threonylcarbamoyltransferase complex dimerization subunit type 1 TsaB n=1 Tax=Jatrophihabitans sp. TaxID=1932789 RepID=UPI002CE296D0|nr:tRNA (adenosine(37)-N6)-threonylcarbamoyltransferase complex dimerization subunit type 1 TsaB [Jatrophihabitans sp.]